MKTDIYSDLFVPYDITKEFISKGFDANCLGFYATQRDETYDNKPLDKPTLFPSVENHKETAWIRKVKIDCIAPTWSQVIDWLFEKHDIVISYTQNTTKNHQPIIDALTHILTRI